MNNQDIENYPSRKTGYSAVIVMTFAQVFAFIDRQIPAMLVEPIKQDFSLNDSQIALLGGAAFSIFYAIMALPIGYAVDRYKRVNVLGTGIFVWSLMTTLAGLANSFGRLFGARIGVAVGEAVMAPVSVSLVSDYFPQNKQGKPMGIITAGVYIGIGTTLIGGGYLIDYLTDIGGITIPGIGYFKPWQATFLVVGIPGILISVAAFMLHEPRRLGLAQTPEKDSKSINIFSHLIKNKSTLIPMFAGLIFMALIFYSFTFWAPSMMVRTHGLSLTEVGFGLGIITIISSILGTISSGAVVDYLRSKGRTDAPIRTAMFACIFAMPAICLAPLVENVVAAWTLIGIYLFFISSFAPIGLLAVSGVSSNEVKGQMAAVHAFLMMAFGLSLGPQITAFFTDFILQDESKLGLAVSLTGGLVLPIAAVCFWMSLKRYRKAYDQLAV
jgi:predicted MFS family arabinose efflux permease